MQYSNLYHQNELADREISGGEFYRIREQRDSRDHPDAQSPTCVPEVTYSVVKKPKKSSRYENTRILSQLLFLNIHHHLAINETARGEKNL